MLIVLYLSHIIITKYIINIIFEKGQVSLETDFKRAAGGEIAAVMLKPNGPWRLMVKLSSYSRKPYVIKAGYYMYL